MSVLQKLTNRFPTNVTIPTNASEVAIEALKQIRRLTLPSKKRADYTPIVQRTGYISDTVKVPKTPATKFNSFVSEIKSRGVAKQYNYMVEIMPPPFLVPEPTHAHLIRLLCDQISFPEMALGTATIKDYGLNREVVYDKLYGNVTASFLCDQHMIVKDFFDTWISGPVHKKNGVFAYPNRYISHQILIHQLNPKKQIVYTVTLNRVTLKLVNDIILSASGKDASRFQVMFAYESWDSKRIQPTSEVSNPASTDIGSKIIKDSKNNGAVISIPKATVVTDSKLVDVFYDFGYGEDVKQLATVGDRVNGIIDSVIGGITDAGNAVNNVVGGAINSVTGQVSGTINGVISGVTGTITSIGNIPNAIVSGVSNTITTTVNASTGIVSTITNAGTAISNTVNGVTNTITTT